jgi:hypothetical protein
MITATLLPLMDADDAAANVRPGWIPLLIVLALGAFIAFLYFSLKKQLGRIDFPEGAEETEDENGDSTTPSAQA